MFVQLILYCCSPTVPLPGSQVAPAYCLEADKAIYTSKNMKILNMQEPNPSVPPERTSLENLPLGDAP